MNASQMTAYVFCIPINNKQPTNDIILHFSINHHREKLMLLTTSILLILLCMFAALYARSKHHNRHPRTPQPEDPPVEPGPGPEPPGPPGTVPGKEVGFKWMHATYQQGYSSVYRNCVHWSMV
jgi:hypothetical protein